MEQGPDLIIVRERANSLRGDIGVQSTVGFI